MTPNKSVPGGCVVAFFGLFAWGYAGISIYGMFAIHRVRESRGIPDEEFEKALSSLVLHASVAFLVGVALFWVGWCLAMKVAGKYNPTDPHQPAMKF